WSSWPRSPSCLSQLLAQVRRHVFVDIFEHRRDGWNVAVEQRAVLRGLLERRSDLGIERLLRRFVLLLGPFAEADQVPFQPCDRIAEGKLLPVVSRPIARRIVRGRMGAGTIGDPFDERRPEVAASALGGPLRCRDDGEKVVAVYAQ